MNLAEPFRVIAHRGASGYAPENTMAAFRLAAEMGVAEVETDVGFTRDRRLLLFHDNTLDRTTDGAGRPGDFTLEELRRLDAGSWSDPRLSWRRSYAGERLITLEELLDEFGDSLTYHVEIKRPEPGLVASVLHVIRARQLLDRVFITAINDDASLLEALAIAPSVRVASACGRKISERGADAIRECAASGFAMVVLSSSNHAQELVDLAHSLGMEARSSGIQNRGQMVEAARMGCNGMTINWPDWLQEYVLGAGREADASDR